MHIEFLVEDSSGEKLLQLLLPRLLGGLPIQPTWRTHSYKGIGRIPRGLTNRADPAKRMLLDNLPRLLGGYGRTPGVDAVVVVLDVDRRVCRDFLAELKEVAAARDPAPNTLFRLAIEEIEAWYFGDKTALLKAYPRANKKIIEHYVQDSICGTWELLADAVCPGGAASVGKAGGRTPGQLKHEWAEKVGPFMDVGRNASPSFRKLRDGVRRLVSPGQALS